MMDKTGLYSDVIISFAWIMSNDKEWYIRYFG